MSNEALIEAAECVLSDELRLASYHKGNFKKPQSCDIIIVSADPQSNYGEYLRPGERPSVEDFSSLIYFNLRNRSGKLILDKTPKIYSEYIATISKD